MLTPLVFNPKFSFFFSQVSPQVYQDTQWTYWDNQYTQFSKDAHGYALRPWGNVGVQYGLIALKDGLINPAQFIDLNFHIGGWKPANEMMPENGLLFGLDGLYLWATQWSHHNAYQSVDGQPARRAKISKHAIEESVKSGQIFSGVLNMPVIDVRHYLEEKLDMHHMVASFSSRLRIQNNNNRYNQAIWVSKKPYDPSQKAVDTLRNFLEKIPLKAQVEDMCFDEKGNILSFGDSVWDGEWNNKPPGSCSQVYPHYGTPRTAAGEGYEGDVLACELISVSEAIERRVYAPIDMKKFQIKLESVFPDGVCYYPSMKNH